MDAWLNLLLDTQQITFWYTYVPCHIGDIRILKNYSLFT